MLRIAAICFFIVSGVSSALAQGGGGYPSSPTSVVTAVGEADIKPGAPQHLEHPGDRSVLRSAAAKAIAGRFYVYGLSADRLGSDRPVEVTVTVDGRASIWCCGRSTMWRSPRSKRRSYGR